MKPDDFGKKKKRNARREARRVNQSAGGIGLPQMFKTCDCGRKVSIPPIDSFASCPCGKMVYRWE